MKRVLTIIILISVHYCYAQNYACLQSGEKHYFINNNNYLRGIRIDSVNTINDSIIYYPFHTLRGYFHSGSTIDTGGSWIGERAINIGDSVFLFQNYLQNNILIKPQATIGSAWIFYSDTTARYYQATVTAIDTATVLGNIDSVKTILVNAYDANGILGSDPINGFHIILSKNHGFCQIFDLYTFPYRDSTGGYDPGSDYFYEICGSQIFNIVDFHDRQLTDFYSFQTGDVFEYSFDNTTMNNTSNGFYSDSVIAKTSNDTMVNIQFFRKAVTYTSSPPSSSTSSSIITTNINATLLLDTLMMPEEVGSGTLYYYYPGNISWCDTSDRYATIDGVLFNTFEPCGVYEDYKLGLGEIEYSICTDPGTSGSDHTLVYYKKGNNFCGSYHDIPLRVTDIEQAANNIAIYPNPAKDNFTITGNTIITDIEIITPEGSVVFQQHQTGIKQIKVNIANLPAGIYFVKINNSLVTKLIKE